MFGFNIARRRQGLIQVDFIDLHINFVKIQGGSNMTGTDLCVNKPHYAAAVRP